jgi:hypothetical protein
MLLIAPSPRGKDGWRENHPLVVATEKKSPWGKEKGKSEGICIPKTRTSGQGEQAWLSVKDKQGQYRQSQSSNHSAAAASSCTMCPR